MKSLHAKRSFLRYRLTALSVVVALIVGSVGFGMAPKKSEALLGIGDTVIEVGPNVVQNTVNATVNTLSSIANVSMATKENILDPIFYMLAKMFLRQMVASIVNWINSGFQGSPAFVTDLDGFLRSVADAAIGEFIYNDPNLNFLCSPFQLDVKIALQTQYSASRAENYQPQCTLSEVMGNVENFAQGAMPDSGWGGFVESTINPVNNPTGAYLSAQGEAYIRIIDAQGQEVTKLNFGDGFFSMEICDVAEQQSGAKPNCTIGTPGSVIANSINKALGAGQDELISADEINEIFNALFAQLAQKAISGVFGLLGMGGQSGYNNARYDNSYNFDTNQSYIDNALALDASSTVNTTLNGQSPITNSLQTEREYLTLQNEVVTRVTAAENNYSTTIARMRSQSCSTGISFPNELTQAKTDAQQQIPISTTVISILSAMEYDFNNATSTNAQMAVMQSYNQLLSQNLLHTAADVTVLELNIDYDLVPRITDLGNRLRSAENSCNQDDRDN